MPFLKLYLKCPVWHRAVSRTQWNFDKSTYFMKTGCCFKCLIGFWIRNYTTEKITSILCYRKQKNILRELRFIKQEVVGNWSQRMLISPLPSVQKPKLGPDLIDYKSLKQLISDQTNCFFLEVALRQLKLK